MATPLANRPLAGRRILVCRPEPEASRLASHLQSLGATTRTLSLIERQPLPDSPQLRTVLQQLDQFQHVIAVSPFAAQQLLEQLDHWWPQWPVGIHWYGVGKGTGQVFAAAGLRVTVPATGVTSEALLAVASLQQVTGDKVLIARGTDGRDLLQETLQARGAQVTLLPLYERRFPDYAESSLQSLFHDFAPDSLVVLSGDTLQRLVQLAAHLDTGLLQRQLLLPAARVASQAQQLGFTQVIVPASLSDEGIATALTRSLQGEADVN
ncbi:MAG: uroporphyrinogen-III synthase [Marinobacter sp.]|nr:uroporphyrinogen-III synthase [Marinobacter sp.]